MDGDFYLNTATSDVYLRASGVYSIAVNIKGANGTNGTNGTNGAAGAVWRNGSGAPSNALGVDGDYYLNTATSDVYFRSGGTYSLIVNIKGSPGAGSGDVVGPAGAVANNIALFSGTTGKAILDSGVALSGLLATSSLGSTVQGFSAETDAIAALAATAGFLKKNGAGSYSIDTNTYLTSAVTTINFGSTGLTPSSATSGAVTVAGMLGLANGGTGQTTAPAAGTALDGYTTTVTSASTVTLTAASARKQFFTGTLSQTVVLPDVTTLQLGWTYTVVNLAANNVAVQSSGANAIGSVQPGNSICAYTCVLTTGTTAASWQQVFYGAVNKTGSGNLVYGTSPTISTPLITFSTASTVTAGTNAQGQGALTNDLNIVTTAANNPSGVTLPTATVGRRVRIVNKGANPIVIYPATGAAIDALAANAGIQLAVGSSVFFDAASTTLWYSSVSDFTISGPGGIGYSVGAGGTVTQATSSATGVTLNNTTGAITMFTAAGSATPASFTVTNSTVGANDAVILAVKSGATNVYNLAVTSISAGSYVVTFWTTGGVASDTPVITQTVIKGAVA